MLRWFKIFVYAVCLTFACQTSAFAKADNSNGEEKHTFIHEHQENAQATISDAQNLARLCSSVPERVLPSSNFTHTLRTPVRPHNLFFIQKISFANYHGQGITVSKPILAVPSCAYYVLTLRHLLC